MIRSHLVRPFQGVQQGVMIPDPNEMINKVVWHLAGFHECQRQQILSLVQYLSQFPVQPGEQCANICGLCKMLHR